MPAQPAVSEIYTIAAKRIVLAWLKEFFASRADFPYKEGDERDTGIRINDKHAFNLSSVTDKPAIILDRKQMRFANATIDKRFGHGGLNAVSGYMDLLECGMIIHCMSKEGLVAENLAHIVAFGIESFRSELRKRGLWDIMTGAIGEESIIVSKAGPEISSVPVMVNVFIQGTWMRKRASSQLVQDFNLVQNP